ncbi:esterase/lipase family protein [Actinokineospora sp. NPDC004072]
MAERLRPDGALVRVGDVTVVSPGMTGQVAVHLPGAPELRGGERPLLADALDRADYDTQLTVEVTTPDEGELVVEVPGPGTGLGQLVLAADEDGLLRWHLPVEAADSQDRGGDRRTYRIPVAAVPPGSGERGLIGALGSKLLKVLVFPLVDPVLGRVGDFFARRWEQRNRPEGLVGMTAGVPGWSTLAEGPALLFLHGTGSSTRTGFAGLPTSLLGDLHTRYGGRVFAYDHHTLSVDPLANARAFAALVPESARLRLDVVAHSRGGLVGRALCELGAEFGLTPDRLAVRTLVMVGTPNAGTALADPEHLGSWMDRLTNWLQLVPDNGVTDVIDMVLTVLKQLAVGAFRGLDGLMSMNPSGEFLGKLNAGGPVEAAYHAIAADYEPPPGSPLARGLRNGLMDAVFGAAPNDLVVPTEGVHAANGAAAFPLPEPEVFDSGHGVDHLTYWSQPRVHAALDRWLAG